MTDPSIPTRLQSEHVSQRIGRNMLRADGVTILDAATVISHFERGGSPGARGAQGHAQVLRDRVPQLVCLSSGFPPSVIGWLGARCLYE